jgi:riboflavin kinase/FMN adenylyltransferase
MKYFPEKSLNYINMTEIYKDTNILNTSKNRAVGIGSFDGVHKGHISVLNKLKRIAEDNDLISTLVTLYPHPSAIIPDKKPVKLIYPLSERIELLSQHNLDEIIVIEFTKELSQLTSEEFINEYLKTRLSTEYLIMGGGHSLGSGGKERHNRLSEIAGEIGIKTVLAESVIFNNQPISSSDIRVYIKNAEFKKAEKTLGRRYKIKGVVVGGSKRGSKLFNIPTINLNIEPDLIYPEGVFAGFVETEAGTYKSSIKIGPSPTFDVEYGIIEAYLFDFNKDLYDREVSIIPLEKLRDIKKYSNAEELKAQIHDDIKNTKLILNKYL